MSEVTLNEQSYRYWIRAQRPDLRWFLGLSQDLQGKLAEIGEDERGRAALELAHAIRDPEAVDAVLSGDEADQEALAIQRMAQGVVEAAFRASSATVPTTKPSAPPAPTMAGLGKRKVEAPLAGAFARSRSFLGRTPDPAAP